MTAIDEAPVVVGGFVQPDQDALDAAELLRDDVNIHQVVLDAVKPHAPDFNVTDSILDARVRETMTGAPTLTIEIHDPDYNLLDSDVLFEDDKDGDRVVRELDVELEPGRWYELAQVSWHDAAAGRGIDITLTLEHRVVADLRKHRRPRKVSRARMTRAEFVQTFAREVKKDRIRFISPELHKKQPLEKLSKTDKKSARDRNRQPGFADNADFTIKGHGATKGQRKNIEEVLRTGDSMGASRKVLIVSVMVGIQESGFQTSATNGDHVGIFQQSRAMGWPATRDPVKDAKGFFEKAIKLDEKKSGQRYEGLAEAVQASGQGHLYAKWRDEAERIVKAFGGTGTESRSRYKVYAFSRGIDGKTEDSWTAAQRMAQEVSWRCFVSGKVNWYFISEPTLFKSRPRLIVRQDHPAVLSVTGDADRGKSSQTLTVRVRIKRWTAPAGSVVIVEGYGADGRWLVEDIERSLFSRDGAVTLKKPTKPKPEPRPDMISVDTTASGKAAKLYQESIKISKAGGTYVYGGGHGAKLRSLKSGQGLDCSSSVSLALFRAGLFDGETAIVSGEFAKSWGQPGKGKQFTVWANGEHVWIQFHSLGKWWRFDTSPYGSGDRGPRVREKSRPTSGFKPRHWPGL